MTAPLQVEGPTGRWIVSSRRLMKRLMVGRSEIGRFVSPSTRVHYSRRGGRPDESFS
jgi:hypothetical protein